MAGKVCKKCNNRIPKSIVIDGKKRNCQRRKYCFDCSPFGQHNTRRLESDLIIRGCRIRICPDCKETHDQRGRRCFRCYFQKRQKEVGLKVQKIVGNACWLCGYDKTKRNLCFHHVDESTKLFGLTTRELMLKWERVFTEMKKCVFICHNCHGEVHDGLIAKEEVERIWYERWGDL